MKIGIVSDTHDHLPHIREAFQRLIEAKVSYIFHCGDYVAPFIIRAIDDLDLDAIELHGVFGNNDGERTGLQKILGKRVQIHGDFYEIALNSTYVAVYHGTDARILQNIIQSHQYDVVLTGHTHQLKIEKVGSTLVVNPGEVCGYLTGKATCALIDLDLPQLDESAVEIIPLGKNF